MKTTHFESKEAAEEARQWFVVDADGQTVGRLASRIARILRGKENPRFNMHNDTGDFVIVLNAEKVKFTGNKLETKIYRHHTGYVGGVKEETAGKLLDRKPEEILRKAVKGMLPKTPLGRSQGLKLKIYKGTEHPHQAQMPQPLREFNTAR